MNEKNGKLQEAYTFIQEKQTNKKHEDAIPNWQPSLKKDVSFVLSEILWCGKVETDLCPPRVLILP